MSNLIAPLIVVTQIILAELVFVFFKKTKRNRFFLRFAVSMFICYGYVFVWLLFNNAWTNVFNYFVLFLTTIFMLYFCFELRLWDAIFWSVAGLTVQHIVYSVLSISSYLYQPLFFNYLFVVIVTVVFLFLQYYLIVKRLSYENIMSGNYKDVLAIAIFVVFTTELLNSLRAIFSDSDSVSLNVIASIYCLLCCVLSLVIQFGLMEKVHLINEITIIKQMWHNDKKQFNSSEQNIQMLNLYCHDMKHILNNMGPSAMDQEFKDKFNDVLSKYEANIHTNNRALDVILTEKSMYCQSHGINFTCIADGEKLDVIKTTDLYSIFGNILNNAIEAVSKLEKDEEKNISLIVNQKNNFIYIHCENVFNGEIKFNGELPETLKKDSRYHGYGLKSVKLYVERYNGNITVNTRDNIFYINILIPIV